MNPTLFAAVQHALNQVPNTKLKGCPGGYNNTYELAAAVDKALARLCDLQSLLEAQKDQP